MTASHTAVLKTKPHFEILDGLRGVAALCVVCFHFTEWAIADYSNNFISHGFLAVDFFFCLSGFVIAYAYDDRMAVLGVWQFLTSRLIRLHPLVILGSVLGLLAFLFDPFGGHPEMYSAGRIALIFLCSVLMVPFGVMSEESYNLFSFNAPAWSLFWEYVANIFYALVLWRLSKRWLWVLLIPAAALIFVLGWRAGNMMGGWSAGTFKQGGTRVFYSFLAGLLVYRCGLKIKNPLGFAGVSVLLVLAFTMPFGKYNWITEPLVVIFYFPLLVALGAGATLNNGLKKLCVFSGNISYPLYTTHYAALWIFKHYVESHKVATGQLFLIIPVSMILLVAIAWVVMVIYDVPVRRYLGRKRNKEMKTAQVK